MKRRDFLHTSLLPALTTAVSFRGTYPIFASDKSPAELAVVRG